MSHPRTASPTSSTSIATPVATALAAFSALAAGSASAQLLPGANLTFENNVGNQVTLITPTSLSLTQFASVGVNPAFPNDIYFTTRGSTRGGEANAQGGFFRSTDGGLTFERTSADVGILDNGEDSFAITPDRPNRVIVVQEKGERSAATINISNDRGATFVQGGTTLPGIFRNAISVEVDPRDPDVIYVGSDTGVAVSRDGGFTFVDAPAPLPSQSPTGSFTPIGNIVAVPNADDGSNVFVAVRQGSTGLFRSVDSGETFDAPNRGLTVFPNNSGPRASAESIGASPADPDRLYVGIFNDTAQRIFRSDDAGASFELLDTVPRSEFVRTDPVPAFSSSNVIRDFAVDPLDADRFVVATNNAQVLWTEDGGDTFTDAGFLFRDIMLLANGQVQIETALGNVRTGSSPQLALSTTGGGPGFGAFNVVFDPSDRNRVFVSTSNGLFAVPVPEPTTGAFVAAAAGATLLRRRRAC